MTEDTFWQAMPMVIGGLGVLGSLQTMYAAVSSRKWPTTQGRLIEKNVATGSAGTPGYRRSFHAVLRYEYFVNGKRYECGKISYGQFGTHNASSADKAINEYSYKNDLTVHYNPRNPKQAVLVPGGAWVSVITLVFSVAVFGMGVFLITRS